MTRNEYTKIVKSIFIGAVFALPLVIILDVFIHEYVGMLIMTVIDVMIFLIAGVAGFIIIDNRNKKFEQKREELKSNKRK